MAGKKNKRNQSAAKTDPNAWMVTFGDLIMLLLTFFVMLLSMKSTDAGELRERFKELSEAVGPMEYTDSKSGVSLVEGAFVNKRSIVITNTEKLQEVLDMMEGIERPDTEDLPVYEFRQIIDIEDTDQGIKISLSFDHLFDSGMAEVRYDRYGFLDTIGHLFRYTANDILIMGHSDSQPLSGSGAFKSNFDLSVYRALSVLYYLTDGLGMKPARFAAGGYGDLQPRFPDNSEENRSRNRRIEFILRKPT